LSFPYTGYCLFDCRRYHKTDFSHFQISPYGVVENKWRHLQKEDNQLADWLGELNPSIKLQIDFFDKKTEDFMYFSNISAIFNNIRGIYPLYTAF
jgi:hypothetical protein